MDTDLIFELNLALIPEAALADACIALSQQLTKKYPAVMQLSDARARLSFPPHLTLYQVPVLGKDVTKLLGLLADVAGQLGVVDAPAVRYAYNSGEASFEVQYEATGELLAWQRAVIDRVNPLRGTLLLERDPAGNTVAGLMQDKGVLGDNLRQTGYGEVGDPAEGGLFRPHVTLNWFELGTAVDGNAASLPDVAGFSGRFDALGVYVLGPYGSCPQRIARYGLVTG